MIVEMVRENAEPGGRDRLSCSAGAWQLLLELGQVFGWKPQGTTYLPQSGSKREVSARHDYAPGDVRDFKRVEADDAARWALALDRARRSPFLAALIADRPGSGAGRDSPEQVRTANAPFTAVMDEFIEYAYGGAFCFAAGAG